MHNVFEPAFFCVGEVLAVPQRHKDIGSIIHIHLAIIDKGSAPYCIGGTFHGALSHIPFQVIRGRFCNLRS